MMGDRAKYGLYSCPHTESGNCERSDYCAAFSCIAALRKTFDWSLSRISELEKDNG